MLLRFAKAITTLNLWIGRLAAWLILPIFVMLIADVAMRYLVGQPAIWTSELAQLLFGVYAVIAGGYLLTQRGHVNVDILYGNFTRRRKALVDISTSFLFFLFVIVLTWQGMSLAWDSVLSLERSQSAWNPHVWPIKLVIPLAGLLLLLQGLVKLIADVRVAIGLPIDEAVFGRQVDSGGHHGEEVAPR